MLTGWRQSVRTNGSFFPPIFVRAANFLTLLDF